MTSKCTYSNPENAYSKLDPVPYLNPVPSNAIDAAITAPKGIEYAWCKIKVVSCSGDNVRVRCAAWARIRNFRCYGLAFWTGYGNFAPTERVVVRVDWSTHHIFGNGNDHHTLVKSTSARSCSASSNIVVRCRAFEGFGRSGWAISDSGTWLRDNGILVGATRSVRGGG